MPLSVEDYCEICKLSFTDWSSYHLHKIRSRRHICCAVCSQDFNTQAGYKAHRNQLHSLEQDLKCPGCERKFNRVGGLVNHLELTECPIISSEEFTARRNEKERWHDLAQDVRVFAVYDTATENFISQSDLATNSEGQNTAPRDILHTSLPWSKLGDRSLGSNGNSEFDRQDKRSCSIREIDAIQVSSADAEHKVVDPQGIDNDLVDFDGPSRTLNAPWVQTSFRGVNVSSMDQTLNHGNFRDSPALSVSDNKNGTAGILNVIDDPILDLANRDDWNTALQLNPRKPPSVKSAAGQHNPLSVATHRENDVWELYDPDSPYFEAKKYFIQFINKFKCPHRGCLKSFESKPLFIKHLTSKAHKGSKLRCRKCLRYFETATALTQHSESQGVRCKIRETDQYATALDEFTAGAAAAAGKLEDNTLRYTVNEEFRPNVTAIRRLIHANKAANHIEDEKFYSYWARHEPKW